MVKTHFYHSRNELQMVKVHFYASKNQFSLLKVDFYACKSYFSMVHRYFYLRKLFLYYLFHYLSRNFFNIKIYIMGNYKKIQVINLPRFNNAEYLAFMNSVLNILPPDDNDDDDRPVIESLDEDVQTSGSPALGLSAEFLQLYEKEVMAMADAVDESRTAQETEQAEVHEKNRDNLIIYITTRISRAGTLPLEAERDAGKYLYKVIKPYIGIARLPVAQETAKIQGLLLDLRKAENAPYVTTLGLEAYLSELEKENNAYIALTSQRTQNRAANQTESGTVLRGRIDEYYDDLVMLAQSFSVAVPSEKATTFINNLNQLISETTTAYNQRKKGSSSKGDKEDDRPVIE